MDMETLKALADDNRLAIVDLLAGRGELCVCEVASSLDLSDALVSHHVGRLRDAGLVVTRRKGRWLHCSLSPSAFSLLAEQTASLAARAVTAAAAADQTGDDSCGCGVPAAAVASGPTEPDRKGT